MNKRDIWDAVKRPPASTLKTIKGGRLNGMTDISPQWRYQAATDLFGPIGFGWKYKIERLWLEPVNNEIVAFAEISLFVKHDGEWSDAIQGIGGSKLLSVEKNGPYVSDECYKMAVTDALSVSLKQLGFGSDIYMGRWDGSKYVDKPEDVYAECVLRNEKSLNAVREYLACNDYSTAKECWREISEDDMMILWKAPSNGGWFTTHEREQMKSNEWAAAQ